MRRREVDAKAAAEAEVLVEGNGASRGAGQGTVRFLRSALELNKIAKGDVLAAERTDPDMVPGMRVASAIMADVGGDTSHAAITSRELGIAAVIGIQRLDILRALDGAEVTVDGTRGKVYRGLLPLHLVGGEMDLSKLPLTKTKVGLVLADVGQALFLSRLRNFPQFEVGLLRAEFMLGNISIHPQALEAFDNGELENVVHSKLKELENRLSKVLREQMAAGLIVFNFNLREYVGEVTGLAAEVEAFAEASKSLNAEEVLMQHRKMRELDHKVDQHLEMASRRIEVLKTSNDLSDHVRIIMGYDDALALLNPADPESAKRVAEIEATVEEHAFHFAQPLVQGFCGRNILKAPEQHVIQQAAQLVEQFFARKKARAVLPPGHGPINLAQQGSHGFIALPCAFKQYIKVGGEHFFGGKDRLKIRMQIKFQRCRAHNEVQQAVDGADVQRAHIAHAAPGAPRKSGHSGIGFTCWRAGRLSFAPLGQSAPQPETFGQEGARAGHLL